MTVFAHPIAFGFGLALIGFSGFFGVGRLGRPVSGCLVNACWHALSSWLTCTPVDSNGVDVYARQLTEQPPATAYPAVVRSLLPFTTLPHLP